MSKLGVVAWREYRETVRKRWFLILTLITPFLFAALALGPGLLLGRGSGERAVAVLDGTGRLRAGIEAALATSAAEARNPARRGAAGALRLEFPPADDLARATEGELARLRARELDAVVAIEPGAVEGSGRAVYYSRTATDLFGRELLAAAVNRAVTEARVLALGVSGERAQELLRRVELEAIQLTREGEQLRRGEVEFLVAFAFSLMLLLPTLLQGQEILRGIVQEKSDRVIETLVSSMSAFDLLTGKVVGMALVGLTQVALWLLVGAVLSVAAAGPLVGAGFDLLALVGPGTALAFALFYMLGYFTYACVYAIGGACVNSEKEGQQLLMPIVLFLMLPWFVIPNLLAEPESTLATTLSLVPVFTPLVMFLRVLVGEPPPWQVALSVLLSLLAIAALFALAARIFRVGILWYGKRPSLPEFLRWVRQP